MKNMTFTFLIIALFPLTAASAFSQEKPYTAAEAFEALKGIAGEWSTVTHQVPVGMTREDVMPREGHLSYRVIGNGSAIMGTYFAGTPMEMISLYHQDGPDALYEAHYCAFQNQPVLSFVPSQEPGVIDLRYVRGTNMDVNKDPHVHGNIFRIIDADHFELDTIQWRNGKRELVSHIVLTRQ